MEKSNTEYQPANATNQESIKYNSISRTKYFFSHKYEK